MTIHISHVEAAWLGITFLALVLCLGLLMDAYRDRRAVVRGNGRLRAVATDGRLMGERFRVLISGCLLGVAVPGIFSDREVTLSLPVALLMAVPSALLVWAYLDTRRYRLLMHLVSREAR